MKEKKSAFRSIHQTMDWLIVIFVGVLIYPASVIAQQDTDQSTREMEEEIWNYLDRRFRSIIHHEPYRSIWLSSNSKTCADEFIAYVNAILTE